MMKHSLIILLLALLVSPRVSSASALMQQPQFPAEEYSVYDAVIDQMFPSGRVSFDFGGQKILKPLVIRSKTYDESSLNGDNYPGVDEETFNDFVSKRKAVWTLVSARFSTLVPHIVVDFDDRERMKTMAETIEANGYATFSRVGFDANRTHAFVSMSYSCGGLCGHGFAVSLMKTDGHWKVQKVNQLWIS